MEIGEESPFSSAAAGPSASRTNGSAGPVFVAVGKDKEVKESKSTLVWALRNMRPFSKVMLAHVHCSAQKIPIPIGGYFPANRLSRQELRAFRLEETRKMNDTLRVYLAICEAYKVQAEILTPEADDIATGLLDLVSQYGITRLVMGASAFSRTTKAPKSKTASALLVQAEPSCNIWFVSKGVLILTRESILLSNGVITQSPRTNLMASPSVVPTRSEPSPSILSPAGLASNPLYQIFRRKSKPSNFDSAKGETIIPKSRQSADHWRATPLSPTFSYCSSKSGGDDAASKSGSASPSKAEDIGNGSIVSGFSTQSFQFSCPSSMSGGDNAASNSGISLTSKDGNFGNGSTVSPLVQESVDDVQPPLASNYQENLAVGNNLYEKLQQSITETSKYKEEAYEESVKRDWAEKELTLANQRVGFLERRLARKSDIQKEFEDKYNKEKAESEKLRKELDKVSRELHVTCQQKLELDANIKDLELKLSQAENSLISLQKDRDLLQQERSQLQQKIDAAAEFEIETLQSQRMEKEISHLRVLHLSEFSDHDILEATDNFNDESKIGESGYGIVYKGFLHQTTVAIKKFHYQSMQGRSEFYNEVEILSRVRHPNLATLIGVCQEAYALIYEFLPGGSLEDRLACKDNTPPLSWQARIRISTEICSALIFLHSARPQRVVHGNLKPANILLDANLVSKLSDFGLSHLLTRSSATSTFCHQTDPKSTYSLDPLITSSGQLAPSDDVYSLGIIILQLLTAKQPFQIVRDVKMALENNRLLELLDQSAGDWPYVQAQQLAHLGLRCCEIDRENRPDLVKEVWRILEPMKKASVGPLYSFGKVEENHNVPSYFMCPIFQEIMSDPYVAADGYTYEAEAIRAWLESGHDTSPMTNLKLESEELTPNFALRSAIQEWIQQRRRT